MLLGRALATSRGAALACALAAVAGMGVVELVDDRGEEQPPRVR